MTVRRFLSDLMLIPRIWRALVKEAREEIAWERRVAEFAAAPADPAAAARRQARGARVAVRAAADEGRRHLGPVV